MDARVEGVTFLSVFPGSNKYMAHYVKEVKAHSKTSISDKKAFLVFLAQVVNLQVSQTLSEKKSELLFLWSIFFMEDSHPCYRSMEGSHPCYMSMNYSN